LAGTWLRAQETCVANSSLVRKVRQLANCVKKALLGCSAQITNLPMASASATVVHSTSLTDGLMNT
jgi:hypothetical protein